MPRLFSLWIVFIAGFFAALAAALTASPAPAQGYGGLGTAAEGFANPDPDYRLSFPEDHGAHPDFRIEWWYLTANLTGEDGEQYGLQWTLFRSALSPEGDNEPWTSPQLWMGHAAVSGEDFHHHGERLARGGIGQAGARVEDGFEAWIDDWAMTSRAEPGEDLYSRLELSASGPDFAYQMALEAEGPLVFHGEEGYSVKSASGQASHYYSQPFYAIEGVIELADREIPVSGQAWLDREFSSQPLAETQTGWDWISLHFDNGNKLMGFRLRQTEGEDYTSASWIEPDGALTPYGDGALTLTPLEMSPTSGPDVPTRWRVELPERGLDVEIEALNADSWMATRFPYWEGPVRITGDGGANRGRGYLEMTGY